MNFVAQLKDVGHNRASYKMEIEAVSLKDAEHIVLMECRKHILGRIVSLVFDVNTREHIVCVEGYRGAGRVWIREVDVMEIVA